MVIWLFVSRCVCVSVSLLRVVCYVYLYGCINICKSKKKVFVPLLLSCYLKVWHCYLASIVAFNIVILISCNLWTKRLNQPTISFIIFWNFAIFYHIFLSPEVKRWAIITYKHGLYELPNELLPNHLRLKILGN